MGRPSIHIDVEEVIELRRKRTDWGEIATRLEVCRNTLYNWRRECGFPDAFDDMTEADLDVMVAQRLNENPLLGMRYLQAQLLVQGYCISRKRVGESMRRVFPEGVEFRKHRAIRRRQYRVPGPHWLWHLDGNHKANKYGLVIHGCIDGCTRAIMFLKCGRSNRSTTVLSLFMTAVHQYQRFPARVYGDRGGENVLVAERIIAERGLNRRSYVAGSSKHNQRIERLWLDVTKKVTSSYLHVWRELERLGELNVEDSLHLFALQYTFLEKLNHALDEFRATWNNHGIRTEHYRTPLQIMDEEAHKAPAPYGPLLDIPAAAAPALVAMPAQGHGADGVAQGGAQVGDGAGGAGGVGVVAGDGVGAGAPAAAVVGGGQQQIGGEVHALGMEGTQNGGSEDDSSSDSSGEEGEDSDQEAGDGDAAGAVVAAEEEEALPQVQLDERCPLSAPKLAVLRAVCPVTWAKQSMEIAVGHFRTVRNVVVYLYHHSMEQIAADLA